MNFKLIKQLLLIVLGTTLMAFAIVNFSVRYSLADGGFAGINLIVYRELNIPIWMTNLVLNVPFIIILYKMFDLKTVLMTIYGVGTLTGALAVWGWFGPMLPDWSNDMLLVVVSYGVLMGIGVGLVIKGNGTTGGSVLVAKILNKKWGTPIPNTLFIFDLAVISLSLVFYLTITNGVYTLIGIFICTVVIAKVQEGRLFGYKVEIISKKYDEISFAVRNQLVRGATLIYATGAHSGHDNRILLVVIAKNELNQLKQIIHDLDPHAFVTVSHTYETLGEGFTYEQRIG